MTAIEATKLLKGGYKSAEQAWRESAEINILKEPSRDKGCPRVAFLGLCAAGLVVGVSPNTYLKSISNRKNAKYSVTAVGLLMRDRNLAQEDHKTLWSLVMSELKENPKKKHNGQMDVVMALWEQNLIVIDREAI